MKISSASIALSLGLGFMSAVLPIKRSTASETVIVVDQIELYRQGRGSHDDTLNVKSGWLRGHIVWGDEWEHHSLDDRDAYGAQLKLEADTHGYTSMVLSQAYINIDPRCDKPEYNHRAIHRCLRKLGISTTYFAGPLTGELEVFKDKPTMAVLEWEASRCRTCEATMDVYIAHYMDMDPPISRTECKITAPGNMAFNFEVRRTQLASYGLNKTQTLNIDCLDGEGALVKIQPPSSIKTGPITAQVDVGAGAARSKYYNLQNGINYINVTVSAEPTEVEPGRYDGSGVMVVLQE